MDLCQGVLKSLAEGMFWCVGVSWGLKLCISDPRLPVNGQEAFFQLRQPAQGEHDSSEGAWVSLPGHWKQLRVVERGQDLQS